MTWPRISRYLAVSSFLLLAILWVVSWFGALSVSSAPFTKFPPYAARIWSGSLEVKLYPDEVRSSEAAVMSVPLERYFKHLGTWSLSDLQIYWESRELMQLRPNRDPDSPLGKFRVGRNFIPFMYDETPSYYAYLQLSLPLWFLWLIFIIPTVLLCRRMQKRSLSGMEKQLATADHSDRKEEIKNP